MISLLGIVKTDKVTYAVRIRAVTKLKFTNRFLVSIFVVGVGQDKIDAPFAISEIHRVIVLLQLINLERKTVSDKNSDQKQQRQSQATD